MDLFLSITSGLALMVSAYGILYQTSRTTKKNLTILHAVLGESNRGCIALDNRILRVAGTQLIIISTGTPEHPRPRTMNLSSPDMAFEPIQISDSSFSQMAVVLDSDSSSTSSNAPIGTLLPDNFEPTNYDVICGRGKGCAEWVGNRRFRVTIAMNKERYIKAPTKVDKSLVVDEIVNTITSLSLNGGGFVKKDEVTGKWYKIDQQAARDKVGHAMRDAVQADQKKERRQNHSSKCRKKNAVSAATPMEMKSAAIPTAPPCISELQPLANQVSYFRSSIRASIRESFRRSLKDSELAAYLIEVLENSNDDNDISSQLSETAIFHFA